ncbi:MAG: glycosidase [Chitinophagaceae bacterium]|nr:glycosidase [Chitinophagaceae bacterium]
MKLDVTRIKLRINPDSRKVIPRFFNTGDTRSKELIAKILLMPEDVADVLLQQVQDEFASRYKSIQAIFLKHYDLVKHLMTAEVETTLSNNKKLLVGSYFTMEYSNEAAALFNPSIVEAPDQIGATEGQKNVIVSFRATGESHISSLVFKAAKLDENAVITFEPDGNFMTTGTVSQPKKDKKAEFAELLLSMNLPENVSSRILTRLPDTFSYKEIERVLKNALKTISSATEKQKIKYDILSMVNINYQLDFPTGSLLSERVIFPVTFTEKNGIEDARFVKFINDDGAVSYIATYTAYDGNFIMPQLIETKDFCRFRMSPLHGTAAINKNLALFPRKINGMYAMVSRIDAVNNYIMFSDDLYTWDTAQLLQQPKYPWEYIQIGNCGAPIETAKGWLLITHGVGPMRKYCLGASLFDINDPGIEIGRLSQPLLLPNEDERHGYVPNVVYSCGSIIHQDKLFIPYAVSDQATSFATVPLNDLLEEILNPA